MKNFYYFLLPLFAIFVFASCDLNIEQAPSNQIYNAASTLVYDPSGEYIFVTEDSVKLFPTSKITIPEAQKDSLLNKRYFISFQIKDQNDKIFSINLLSMQMMLEKHITEIENNQ